MPKQKSKTIILIPDERIVGKIYYIRGKKVMFDKDLAELYGVGTKVLNQAVKRNMKRFPDDFMFQLNKEETNLFLKYQIGTSSDEDLKSQIVISNKGNASRSQIVTLDKSLRSQFVTSKRGGQRYFSYVFTEQGVAMLSSVLNSDRAIQVNIQIMRTFTKLREMLSTHKELREKIEKMERKYDKNFKVVFKVLAKFLKTDPKENEMKIAGFRSDK